MQDAIRKSLPYRKLVVGAFAAIALFIGGMWLIDPDAFPIKGPATMAEQPAADAGTPLSEAERIARLQRDLEQDRKYLDRLTTEFKDPNSEYNRAEKRFQAVDAELQKARQEIQELNKAGKSNEALARAGSLKELQTHWQQNRERFNLAIEEHLAPDKLRKAEELHLKLVRLRGRQPRDPQHLDDLFGIQYVGPGGKFEPGRLAEVQRKRLPAEAIALVQQLALWLPADGGLLWQLAELAGANGDVATAAAIMDGCVTEFGFRAAELRDHRRAYRAAADRRAKEEGDAKTMHEGHLGLFKPRSLRPLVRKLDQTPLPPIDPKGVNVLPWSIVTETTVDRRYRPTFARYLKELDGKKVMLTGYLQPLGDDADLSAFLLIEYPVGCWYCEQPEMTAIVLVELPEGKTHSYTRGSVHVRGKLVLNARDPENFLYTIRDAEISQDE